MIVRGSITVTVNFGDLEVEDLAQVVDEVFCEGWDGELSVISTDIDIIEEDC